MIRTRFPALLLCCALTACSMQTPSFLSYFTGDEDAQIASASAEQGRQLLAEGKLESAISAYKDAVAHDDSNARAWNGLGAAYEMSGNKDDAVDAFLHAVDLAPRDPFIANNLAHAFLENDDAIAAVHLLTPFASEPGAPQALLDNLALAKKQAETQEAANKDAEKGIYADLGSSPTKGMAKKHAAEAKALLGKKARKLTLRIVSETKIAGGTPVFTVKAFGLPPQEVCDALVAKAFPCLAHGK